MQMCINVCAIAAYCVFAVGCRSTGTVAGQPEPGTEYYAVAPETIREVVFSSSDRKLYAYRWSASESFYIYTGGRGTNPEQCTSGDGFTRWLNAIATIPVRAVVDKTVAGEWAEVRLRDATNLEPNDVTLLIPASQSDPVLMRFGQQQYVVEVNAALLRSVNSGCSALGGVK